MTALYFGFLPIFLEYQGKTNDQIGYLLAAAQLVSVFAQSVWGKITDKAKYKNNILAILVIFSSIFFVLVYFGSSMLYLFIMISLVMFFLSNLCGLTDTITIEASGVNQWKYGPLRVMGTLGFGLVSMGLAPFIGGENISLLFVFFAAVGLLSVVFLYMAPKVKGHAEKREKISIKPIFRDRVTVIMFFVMAVSILTFNYYQNFYPKYMIASVENGGLGISEWLMGVNTLITVTGEILFFLFYNKIMEKIGIKKVLWIFGVLSVVRYLSLAYTKNAVLVLTIGFFTGLCPTVFTYCCTFYLMKTVSPSVRASAQMAMYALCNSLPRMMGSGIGGVITESFGTKGGLIFCTLLSALSLISLLALPKKIKTDMRT